jgi:uncharacterized protein (DUF2384 family)
MKRQRIDQRKLPSAVESEDGSRPGKLDATQLAHQVRRRFRTPTTGGRGRDPLWTAKRLMPVRRRTLALLQELASAVSQIVEHRVEPLQMAALLVERDLGLWGPPDRREVATGRTDVSAQTTADVSPGRRQPRDADRIARLIRLARLAEQALGSREKAIAWLHDPNRALGNATPLSRLDTPRGAHQVEALLGHLAHGIHS